MMGINITWELVLKMQMPETHHQPRASEDLRKGPEMCVSSSQVILVDLRAYWN